MVVIDERRRNDLYNGLEESLGAERAETLMAFLPPLGWGDVATKQDIASLRQETKQDIALVKASIAGVKQDVALLRQETKQDIASLLQETKQDIASSEDRLKRELKGEIAVVHAELKADIAAQRWAFEASLRSLSWTIIKTFLGGFVASVIAVAGLMWQVAG